MKNMNFNKIKAGVITTFLLLMMLLATLPSVEADMSYDDTIVNTYQYGNFPEIWDLTASDMTISFTYDGNGLLDEAGCHAYAEFGVRTKGFSNFNPGGEVKVCNYDYTTDLIAGQNMDVGDVHIWNDGDTLYVKYIITDPNWVLTETHIHIANDWTKIPQKNGNPIPGKFQYKQYHIPGVIEYTYSIDFTNLRGADPLYVAAHAVVKNGKNKETAWGDGDDFPGSNWATYIVVDGDCTIVQGVGVWLATDYEWSVNTFNPDPPGAPTLDLDDKLILQRVGGQGEGAYNLPSTPPAPGNNHRFWWDRDGVDPWQNPATANTGGIYQIIITLHATSATTGTAYMNIRGLDQGFEVDGNWNTIELTPAGMTFTGDMEHLQVFYGIYGYGATHSVTFSNIHVTGSNHMTNSRTIIQIEHPFITWILQRIMHRFYLI